jgi:hypothetical protein
VAQDRPVSAGQYGGLPATFGTDPGMPDRIHGAVNPMQSSGLNAPSDRAGADAEATQLLEGYDPMLPGGKSGKR